MSDFTNRMLVEAIRTKRPILVDPSDEEIRKAAEQLQAEGRLICTACRTAIAEEEFETRRISFGPRLQAVAHLHKECLSGFVG